MSYLVKIDFLPGIDYDWMLSTHDGQSSVVVGEYEDQFFGKALSHFESLTNSLGPYRGASLSWEPDE